MQSNSKEEILFYLYYRNNNNKDEGRIGLFNSSTCSVEEIAKFSNWYWPYQVANTQNKIFAIRISEESFEIFNLNTRQISKGPDPPEWRSGVSVAYFKGKLYYLGGEDSETEEDTNQVDVLIDGKWQTGPAFPLPISHVQAITCDEILYVIDGYTSKKVYRLSDNEREWIEIGDIPEMRDSFGIASLNEKIYISGGRGFLNAVKSCLCFDPSAPAGSQISRIADMNYARYRHSLIVANGKLYAIGGSQKNNRNSIEEYDPRIKKWKSVKKTQPVMVQDVPISSAGGAQSTVEMGPQQTVNNLQSARAIESPASTSDPSFFTRPSFDLPASIAKDVSPSAQQQPQLNSAHSISAAPVDAHDDHTQQAAQTEGQVNEGSEKSTAIEEKKSDSEADSSTEKTEQGSIMASEFVYNGVTKKLKASTLKPEVLSRLFKIEEDSLVLTDETGEYYLPEGDCFNPPLSDGKKFEVDGTEKSAPGNTQLIIPKEQRDLAVIQGAKRDRIITNVIENCQNMNEGANMLYHGPQAVFLIESLALLSVCAPDPSLITAEMPKEKFVRLRTPGSFRASLYQVAANMCAAFQTADYSMNTIRASLVDLPDYFETTLDVINQTDDQKTKKVMDKTIQKIENASTKCKEAANKAQEAFSGVLMDIDELCQAAIVTNTTSARELEEMKKLQEELKTKKEFQEKELERQEEMYKEAKKQAADALREYREQVANSGNMGKLFLATLADGLFDTVKDMKDFVSKPVSAVTKIFGTDKVHCSKALNHAAENGILKTLETIHTSLGQIDDLEDNAIDDYIITLKEYQKYSPVTDEGKKLFKKAKDMQKFLENKRKSLKETSLKPEIDQMRAGISIIIQTVTTARQQYQKKERKEQAANSLREKIVKADTEKTKSTQEHYNKQSDREEQLRKELSANKKELTNIICKLQNIDMTKVELTDVIKTLREVIEYLGRVKENWQNLSHLFDNIKIIVENNLSENIQTFIKNAKDDISRKLMLQAALKATGYCIQISNCAAVYTIVSQKYVMPVVSGIGKQFALTQGEAIKKKSEIGTDLNTIMSEVEKLIDNKKEEYHKRTEDYMTTHAEVLVNAISENGKKALENKK